MGDLLSRSAWSRLTAEGVGPNQAIKHLDQRERALGLRAMGGTFKNVWPCLRKVFYANENPALEGWE